MIIISSIVISISCSSKIITLKEFTMLDENQSSNYFLINQNNNQEKYYDQGQYHDLKNVVFQFLALMKSNQYVDKQYRLRSFLSPHYFQKNQLRPTDYLVNSFSPHKIKILAANQKYVCAKIYDSQYRWAHLLLFEMVREQGQIFINPRKNDYQNYLDPWSGEIRNVEKSQQQSFHFQKEKVTLKKY